MVVRRGHRARLLALVTVAATLLAACGNSSSTTSSSAKTSTTAGSATPSKSPIVVGSIVTETGPFGSEEGTQTLTAAKAWEADVNGKGGIDGHPVKVIVKDDQASPTVAAQAAATLLTQDNAVAIIGPETGTVSWYPTIEQKGVPCIGGICGAAIFTDTPQQQYFFSVGTSSATQISSTLAAAKAVGAKKIGVVQCAETVSCAEAGDFLKSAAKASGMSVGDSQTISASASSYAAQCLALMQSGVDSVQLDVAVPTAVRFVEACQAQGYTPHYVSVVQIADKTSIKNSAFNQLNVVLSTFPWFANSTPAEQEFQTAVKTQVPNLTTFSPGYGEYTAVTWAAFKAFQAAAQAIVPTGQQLTGATIASALKATADPTLGGLVGTMNWSQPTTKQGNCFFLIGVKNGNFTQPAGTKAQCVGS